MDTRLVSAVQAAGGARCHESGNLLQRYYFAAAVSTGSLVRKTPTHAKTARSELDDAESALQRFLFECNRPAFAAGRPRTAIHRPPTAIDRVADLV